MSGTYTIALCYNTKSDLGVLTSKRTVTIGIPVLEAQTAAYEAAKIAKNTAKMAKASEILLAHWPNAKVKPNQTCSINTMRYGKRPEDPKQLKAGVRWQPGKDAIVAIVDVIDANFSINPDELHVGSSIGLFFAPNGFDNTRINYVIAPSGPEDTPLMKASGGGPIKATWKRTDTGYQITARVPYSSIPGCSKNWKSMPVDVMVNTKTPKGRCALVMGNGGTPWQAAASYLILLRK